jgi:KUP system potassium uptake protein
LLLLGIFGTSIFFGDGVITPAISVLSAIEGLEVAAPALNSYVVPLTLLVLTGLFMVQRHGTASVGQFFGPVMVVWFAVLAVLGLQHIALNPGVLWALSPHYALVFLLGSTRVAFIALGSVVLCVTGAEALYADLGHFGKRPIRLAWFSLAMPALVLNYFGQGAMLLDHPSRVGNPFYEMAPEWALYPLIGLATCATVIASQALITAAFSVTKQATQLGYLPRMRILHTSVREAGQIYVPFINWGLYVCIVIAVVIFQSTTKLAAAYGIAVTIDMLITTTMTFFVIRYGWKYPWSLSFAATGFFFVVDFVYFSANVVKLFDGGWFPVAIGGVMFLLMMTWKQGRRLMAARLREDAIDLPSFLEAVFVNPPTRVQGTAVFLVAEQGVTPNALLHNLKHNKVLHETNLFVTVKQHEVPWIGFDKRCDMEPLGHNCWQVTLHFGFKNEPDVPHALERLRSSGCAVEDMDTSYFLSRDIVIPTLGGGMSDWREKLFAGMHRNAAAAADFLRLPTNRVVELGSKVEI